MVASQRIDHVDMVVDDYATERLKALGFEFVGSPETVERFMSVWTRPETSDGVRYQLMQIAPPGGAPAET